MAQQKHTGPCAEQCLLFHALENISTVVHSVCIVSGMFVYFSMHCFVSLLIEYSEKKSETLLYLAGNNHLVSKKPLTDDDIEVLCEVLSANTYVTALDLRYNYLTDVGAQHVAQLLLVRPTTATATCTTTTTTTATATATAAATATTTTTTITTAVTLFNWLSFAELLWEGSGLPRVNFYDLWSRYFTG